MEPKQIEPLDLESYVNPELLIPLKQRPETKLPITIEDINVLRETMAISRNSLQKPNDNVTIAVKEIQGLQNTPNVTIRIHQLKSQDQANKRSAILWMHEGAMILGAAEMSDSWCSHLVEEIGCVAFSVEYRLAPEHVYPAGLEDCYTALSWISKSAEELGIDPKKIAIGGHSAGGGLCAALSLLARDRKGPDICFQVPLYPMIDDRNETASSYEITDKRVWNRERSISSWKFYLGDRVKEDLPIYAAPARATDLTNLPSTFTCVGQLDPFRDETIDYASRLMKARVPVELHVYSGAFHACDISHKDTEISRQMNATVLAALKRALKFDK